MDFDTCQRLLKQFDPQKALDANDAGLYVERAYSVAEEFLTEVRFSGGHRFVLVGSVGSGKSTELFRLYQKMEGNQHYVALLVDLFKQFRVDELSAGQVVFLVALAVLRAGNVDRATTEVLLARLGETYLGIVDRADRSQVEVDMGAILKGLSVLVVGAAAGVGQVLGAASAGAAGAATDAINLRVPLPGRGKALQLNDPTAVALHQVLRDVVRAGRESIPGKQFLVLVDGLDKVDSDEKVRELFCTGMLAASGIPGLDLVYAAPPSPLFQTGFGGGGTGFQSLPLGLFGIFQRDGSVNRDEVEAMRELLNLRVHESGLRDDEVWPEGDPAHESVDRMILASGGLTRDLIHIMRNVIIAASNEAGIKRLRVEDINAGIARYRKGYLRRLDLDVEALLKKTWDTRQRPGDPRVRSLLNDNLILYYDNGTPWCRPHPLVMQHLRERFPDIRDDVVL